MRFWASHKTCGLLALVMWSSAMLLQEDQQWVLVTVGLIQLRHETALMKTNQGDMLTCK